MMTVDVNQLKFPVISYDERSISTHRRRFNLTSSIESFVDKGGFLGEKIIDSSGRKYEIVGVRKEGWSIFNLLHPLFIVIEPGDKIVKIRLELAHLEVLKFAGVYQEIHELLARHPEWMPGYQKTHTHKLLEKANSIEDLISIGFADGNPL